MLISIMCILYHIDTHFTIFIYLYRNVYVNEVRINEINIKIK